MAVVVTVTAANDIAMAIAIAIAIDTAIDIALNGNKRLWIP